MRKIIKSTDLIPPLFNIDNYVDMDKLTAFEWFYLLETRYMIYHEIFENGLSFWVMDGLLTDIEEQEATQLLIQNFFNNPLGLNLSIDFKKHNGEILTIRVSDTNHSSFMEHNLPVSDFYDSTFAFFHYVAKQNNIELGVGENKYRSRKPILHIIEPLVSDDFIFVDYPITINPSYPDTVIIEELKKILIKIRDKRGIHDRNKVLSKRDLINWASYKLLPYFDLKLLEIYNGIKITNSVICSVLYPKGEYGEDNLRKSVEPLRQKVLTQLGFDERDDIKEISIFDALCYLGYGEIDKSEK